MKTDKHTRRRREAHRQDPKEKLKIKRSEEKTEKNGKRNRSHVTSACKGFPGTLRHVTLDYTCTLFFLSLSFSPPACSTLGQVEEDGGREGRREGRGEGWGERLVKGREGGKGRWEGRR